MKVDVSSILNAAIELPDGFDDPEAATHRPLDIVLVRRRKSEVDHDAVAQEVVNVAIKAAHDGCADAMIGSQSLAQLLGIKAFGKLNRAHEIAEQTRQLPPFRPRLGHDRRARHCRLRQHEWRPTLETKLRLRRILGVTPRAPHHSPPSIRQIATNAPSLNLQDGLET